MRRRVPLTLWLGLLYVICCEVLLFSDVLLSDRGAVRTHSEVLAVLADRPDGPFGRFARWVAVNMTPLVWPGYVVFLEGVLTLQTGGSPVRRRPRA